MSNVPRAYPPLTPVPYSLTSVGETLIWLINVQPGEQVAVFRGSNLKSGVTTDGGDPLPGAPILVILNLEHDGLVNWSIQHGIGPTGAAAVAAGLAVTTYPIPAGPGPFPPLSSGIPVAVNDDLIVQHDGVAPSTMRICCVVVLP